MAFGRFLKNVFEPRSIGSTIGDPKRIAQRLELAAGLLKDVPKGKLSVKTLKLLQEAVLDTIAESPFLREPGSSHGSHEDAKVQILSSSSTGMKFIIQGNPHTFIVDFIQILGRAFDIPRHLELLPRIPIGPIRDPERFVEERLIGEAIRPLGPTREVSITQFRDVQAAFNALLGALRFLGHPV